mgnify:CR=1 FL=1
MKCPNCGTWNPDDKIKCWRCSTELPKPQPKKQPQATRIVGGLPVWAWVLLGLMLALWLLFQCSAPLAPR